MAEATFFWQRSQPGPPVFSRGFESAEHAEGWAEARADEHLWPRLLLCDERSVIWDVTNTGGPAAVEASEALDVAERAPISDEARRAVALWAAGVGRRDLASAELLLCRAAQVLRMTRGVQR